MIAIVDYGCGNLFSLSSSLKFLGEDCLVTGKKDDILSADKIILPGVGAFGDAVAKLHNAELFDVIRQCADDGKYILGICLGMQMLFDKSYEYGEHLGLGLIKGEVRPFKGVIRDELKIPHMGWNPLNIKKSDHPLLKYTNEGDCVYFVHSYYAADCDEAVIATSEYDIDVTAAVAKGNVYGCQFHPEKSGEVGLKILKAFCEAEGGKSC